MERNLIAKEIDNLAWSRQYDSPEPALSLFTAEQKAVYVKQIQKACAAELKIWEGKEESDEGMYDHVRRYFVKGSGLQKTYVDAQLKKRVEMLKTDPLNAPAHWSAAFVTYIMRTAYPNFKPAAKHTQYIAWAKQNRNTQAHPFQAFPINEVTVEPGDIICQARERANWATYDNAETFPPSHGDIVVQVKDGVATTVGGNVLLNVQRSKFKLDSAGKLIQKYHSKIKKPRFFAVIKIVPFTPLDATLASTTPPATANKEWDVPGLLNVPNAVRENRRHALILGWENHLHAISKYVFMKPLVTDEAQFVSEVARWQQLQRLPANGIVSEPVWEKMKLQIPKVTPEQLVANWKGEYVSRLSVKGKEHLAMIIREIQKSPVTNKYLKAAILAVTSKEGDFTVLVEQSYKNTRAARIRAVFGKRIKDKIAADPALAEKLTDNFLEELAKNDENFFDFFYGKGQFKYRGRGFNQVTQIGNYKMIGIKLGLPLVTKPDLLEEPAIAAKAVSAYFDYKLNTRAGKAHLQQSYNAADMNSFTDLKNAVLACYHANAGIKNTYGKVWPFTIQQKDAASIEKLASWFPEAKEKKSAHIRGKRLSLIRATEMLQLVNALDTPVN